MVAFTQNVKQGAILVGDRGCLGGTYAKYAKIAEKWSLIVLRFWGVSCFSRWGMRIFFLEERYLSQKKIIFL